MVQDQVLLDLLGIRHLSLIIQIYMTGVNVRGMYSINVPKLVKELVHIGGMPITGIQLLQRMVIQ